MIAAALTAHGFRPHPTTPNAWIGDAPDRLAFVRIDRAGSFIELRETGLLPDRNGCTFASTDLWFDGEFWVKLPGKDQRQTEWTRATAFTIARAINRREAIAA